MKIPFLNFGATHQPMKMEMMNAFEKVYDLLCDFLHFIVILLHVRNAVCDQYL